MKNSRLMWVVLLCFCVTNVACGEILGIVDAELDPTLGAGAAGAGDAVGGAGGASPSRCESFCATMDSACTDGKEAYGDPSICEALCTHFEGADSGEANLSCKEAQADAATKLGADNASECAAAGPGGENICGENCFGYCLLFEKLCPNTFAEDYDNQPACKDACGEFSDAPDVLYNISFTTGDTLECRLYHVSAAALLADKSEDDNIHCEHARKVPSSQCVNDGGGGAGAGGAGAGGT